MDKLRELMENEQQGDIDIDDVVYAAFVAEFCNQENEHVDGSSYLRIPTGEEQDDYYEAVDYARETPEAVTREILDRRIPDLVEDYKMPPQD
jgi:hypothetical protein